jgi:hypothetical protein
MSPQPETGYIVLSDLSGFTGYLAGVELDHAQAVLRDLSEMLVGRLVPPLTLGGLVGDGLLAYLPVRRLARGETLLEVVEAAYGAFRERVGSIARRTTCTCRACRQVPELDLKFIIHCGAFVLQAVPAGQPQPELLGLDVDLVRKRWLKLPVGAVTGWRGYALFTGAALRQMGLRPETLEAHKQVVAVGHAGGPSGEVVTYSVNLRARFDQQLRARRAYVGADEADAVVVQDFAAQPAVVWEWLNEPARRTQWMQGRVWHSGARPEGRMGVGARNHCEHGLGTATEIVLDWRPFEYFTVELTPRPGSLTVRQTFRLEPLAAGTRVHSHTLFVRPLPRWLARPLCRLSIGATLKADLARLAPLVARER